MLLFGATAMAAPPKWPVVALVESSEVILEAGLFPIFEPQSFQLFKLSATRVLKGAAVPPLDSFVIAARPSFHEGPRNPGPIPLFASHLLFLDESKPTPEEFRQARMALI